MEVFNKNMRFMEGISDVEIEWDTYQYWWKFDVDIVTGEYRVMFCHGLGVDFTIEDLSIIQKDMERIEKHIYTTGNAPE